LDFVTLHETGTYLQMETRAVFDEVISLDIDFVRLDRGGFGDGGLEMSHKTAEAEKTEI
jgi:hypothetical protein